jgi:hypothetical protein
MPTFWDNLLNYKDIDLYGSALVQYAVLLSY